ncbi:hypothetical protein Tcan_03963 [Toxocara canis]|uniref:Uncharacterized protein n=1 Tax=Toxocara canis TaxID=6265 RepID=A0A0B2USM4_TOXCA|nr:hypothetical protein Tcan_03963 [Toxocara canis]
MRKRSPHSTIAKNAVKCAGGKCNRIFSVELQQLANTTDMGRFRSTPKRKSNITVATLSIAQIGDNKECRNMRRIREHNDEETTFSGVSFYSFGYW